MKKILLIIIFLPFLATGQNGQGKKDLKVEDIRELEQVNDTADILYKQFPIIYFTAGSDTAEKIKAEGKVLAVSSPGFYCGSFCQAGTMKVEVSSTSDKTNPDKIIYVLIGCFMPEKDMVGKKVELLMNRMTDAMHIGCFKESVFNTLDSKGSPFYYCINYW